MVRKLILKYMETVHVQIILSDNGKHMYWNISMFLATSSNTDNICDSLLASLDNVSYGVYSLRKEFANSFLLELTLIEKGGRTDRVAPPED